jgi:N6-adenosine-specific RNA methylase IME4
MTFDQVTWRTLVADPPWAQDGGPQFPKTRKSGRDYYQTSVRSRPLPYPTMDVPAIESLPVGDLAAPDAHLYLWVTNRYIEAGYGIARAWGFRPVVLLTWAKAPRGIGLGGTFVQTTEHVLFARRGTLKAKTRVDSTWWQWTRQDAAHSRKPDAFLDLVETVSPGPYLELFARRQRLGWDTWGNQALEHVALTT